MRRLRRAHQKYLKQHKRFRRTAVAAGAAAAITLAAAASRNYAVAGHTPDEHQLPISQDADGDLLADGEETALAYRVADPDQNHNGILDGVELAKCCADAFKQLPDCGDAEPNDIC